MLAQNTSKTQETVDDDEELFETANAQDDFDALNEEKVQYNKYAVMSYMQDN